ncbi:MAG: response regulator [Chloroflexi bacterium]|nr:MAG: response regulator [Chloroflexota bacterium]
MPPADSRPNDDNDSDIRTLKHRLYEAEQTLQAIYQGQVDALVVSTEQGLRVFTLRSAEQPYRLLVEQMNQGAAMLSAEGTILYCNRRLAEILNLPPSRLTGQLFHTLLAPDSRQMWERLVQQAQQGRSEGELWASPPGRQKPVPLFLALNRLPAEAGAEFGLLATDLTERKQAEEELRRRNRELALLNRIITASAGAENETQLLTIACAELAQTLKLDRAAALLFDADRTQARVAAEYRRPHHRPALHLRVPLVNMERWKAFFNRSWFICENTAADERLAPYASWLEQFQVGAIAVFPLTAEARSEGVLALISAVPRRFAGPDIELASRVVEQVNSVLTRLALGRDRQRLEEQFLQAQKMEAIGRLAGGVAHDFNNLLTVINGHCDWLMTHLPPDHPFRADLEPIRSAGERAALLTRRLLALSRQQVLRPERLNLNQVIGDLQDILSRLIGENIALRLQLAPDLPPVWADKGQLEQVILNLVVNARDAMPQGGTITLETANVTLDETYARRHLDVEPGSYVMLAVSDTGHGMDKETIRHIFEPFFTTKESGKGTGLGLSTVHGIVRQSGGHIQVYSEPGQGSVFKIYLPVAEPSAAAEPAVLPPPVQALSGTETILIAEDDPAVRQLMRQVLTSNGYTVLDAATGRQALQIFTPGVQLLLTDVVLPDMNGQELAGQLRQQQPDLKVLYTSGYTSEAIVHQGILEAGLAFLQKPFTPSILLRRLREVLDAS